MSFAKSLIGISKHLRRKSRITFMGAHRDHDLQSERRIWGRHGCDLEKNSQILDHDILLGKNE